MAEKNINPEEVISQMVEQDEQLRAKRDYKVDIEKIHESLMEAEFLNFRDTLLHIQALQYDGRIDDEAFEENWKKIEQIAKENHEIDFVEELDAYRSDIKYNQMIYDLFLAAKKNLAKEILDGRIKLPKPQVINFLRMRGYKEMLLMPGHLYYHQQISELNQAIRKVCGLTIVDFPLNPPFASGVTHEERPGFIYPIMLDVKTDPKLSYPAKSIPIRTSMKEHRRHLDIFNQAIKGREKEVKVQGLNLPEYAMLGLYMNATYRQVAPDFTDLNIDGGSVYTVLFGEEVQLNNEESYMLANWSQNDKKFQIKAIPEGLLYFSRFAAGFESEAYE